MNKNYLQANSNGLPLLLLLLLVVWTTLISELAEARLVKLHGHNNRNNSNNGNSSRAHGRYRIVGGYPVEPGMFPPFVTLRFVEENPFAQPFEHSLCGGTIIGPRLVLTAAHCIEGVTRSMYVTTSINPHKPFPGFGDPEIYRVVQVCDSKQVDLAVLKLELAVNFNGWVNKAELADAPLRPTEQAYVVGSGVIDESNHKPSSVKALPVLATDCIQDFSPARDICVLANKYWADGRACPGDSGSPILAQFDYKFYVYGVHTHRPRHWDGSRSPCSLNTPNNMVFIDVIKNIGLIFDLMSQCRNH